MSESVEDKVFSTVPSASFIGRESEMETIVSHAENGVGGLVLLAKPAAGSTELLCQAYDRLFSNHGNVVPFYFEFRPNDLNAKRAAVRFLQSFITQLTAFRRNSPELIAVTPDICEIGDLSSPSDGTWIDSLVQSCKIDSELNDEASFIRQAFSAPFRAATEKSCIFPMIGGIEHTAGFAGETDLFEQLKESFGAARSPFLFCGKRRFLANGLKKGSSPLNNVIELEIENLDLVTGSLLCEALGEKHSVETTPQTRDLIGLQLEGSPLFISALVQAAAAENCGLDSFKDVEQTYTKELFGGRIRAYFDSAFDNFTRNTETQRKLVDLLFGAKEFSKTSAPSDSWNKSLGLGSAGFRTLISAINNDEFINCTTNLIDGSGGSVVFNDYLAMRFRLEIERASRSAVYGGAVTKYLKRAPIMMAEFYRKKSSIGLKELLGVFDCQEIPVSLVSYDSFKQNYKGKPDEAIAADLINETEKIALPQIVYSVNTVSVYDQLSKFTQRERSAVAIGFEAADYTEESETAWIAAEVDSKLEADAKITSFWCDRLEMVALMSDFRQFRLWLIAPEGFSPEAVEVLKKRNAIGSSRKQIELLVKYLGAEKIIGEIKPDNAFEMVVPMGDDTELIAAHAVEEIARRHSFDAKSINQIKTALVEACINATEHSHSPDRRIYQRFEIKNGSILITVSNRGLRFKGKETQEISPTTGRRGWGLKLMKTLMDEVKFEQVDDGTRILMSKRLVKK